MSDEKKEAPQQFITVNGRTFVAPPVPKLEDGEVVLASSYVITGKTCKRCGKLLTASQSTVGGQVTEQLDMPQHDEEDCNLHVVQEIHEL